MCCILSVAEWYIWFLDQRVFGLNCSDWVDKTGPPKGPLLLLLWTCKQAINCICVLVFYYFLTSLNLLLLLLRSFVALYHDFSFVTPGLNPALTYKLFRS